MARPTISKRCAVLFAACTSLVSPPAMADQFLQTSDGGTVQCSVSARELTRFALIGDQFASVSKISSGYPYNDFAVSNEPVRGDIYVSVPETFAAARISFFATTKKGFVYKFACSIDRIDAAQVFVANPGIAKDDAARWERETPLDETAVRLVQAMAGETTIDGYKVKQSAAPPARAGEIEVQLVADYRGAELTGQVLKLTNRGGKPVTIEASELAPRDALAVAILQPTLAAGQSTTAYLVAANGSQAHD